MLVWISANLHNSPSVHLNTYLIARPSLISLTGVPSVRLYQDSLFVKRSGDGPTQWHSDLNQTPFDGNDFITCWIPLQDVPSIEEGGTPLMFATSSHRDFALPFCKFTLRYFHIYPTLISFSIDKGLILGRQIVPRGTMSSHMVRYH